MANFSSPAPESTPEEIAAATGRAATAFARYASTSATERATFLERVATKIEELGDELIETAERETNLPKPRLIGERGRTCGQLRMFANLIRTSDWLDVRIEHADPSRQPLPKPDLRRTQVPLGPVAVFGASNFPLAFSVPGGDTASALAAGCPVVVKGHPAHPETSRLCAEAIAAAVTECGLPEGVFGVVWGGVEPGRLLVEDPNIYAVGFTGSRRAGRALYDLAAARERPIPVFAEMGSVNPVFVFPGALALRSEAFAKGYADSLTLGVGQFCTNPGVLVGPAGAAFDAMLWRVAEHLAAIVPGTMLSPSIRDAYVQGVEGLRDQDRLRPFHCGEGTAPALFAVDAADFLAAPELREEVFGPAALAVRCASPAETQAVAAILEGQLTATVHFEPEDLGAVRDLLPSLVKMAGRLVANGFPTGVEVNSAMQHGGPYPATTDGRFTSVGTAAIHRFVRPVAFQDFPAELLPEELR